MNKALFLDRDGVVNIDKNYVHKTEEVEFISGIFEFCRFFQEKDYLIFIITNQAGIARGFYTIDDFHQLSDWMAEEFQKRGVRISKTYFCPHHPEITGPCDCRKPQPGMLLQASREFDLDLTDSILIGNNESDIKAGENAGLRKNYLFTTSTDFQKIIAAEQKN
jgi:D-glycero-D-manno-heptose 1,7-bisphosphate phosphatase